MGVGTANGIIADTKVVSGNKGDKTYNHQNLDEVDNLLERANSSKEDFYYIADCSLFTEKNIIKAKEKDFYNLWGVLFYYYSKGTFYLFSHLYKSSYFDLLTISILKLDKEQIIFLASSNS